MAVLRSSKSQTADASDIISRIGDRKYFTLEAIGVPLDQRVSAGVKLAKLGYNKFNLRVRAGKNAWVWLGKPGDTDFSYDEARAALFGGNSAAP